MAFQLDFNDTFEARVDDGVYEVVVNRCNENVTPGGAEYIEFELIIRNDIDQKFKNYRIFHKIWKNKETGKYNMRMFNTIGKACRLQNGKTYRSLDELLQDFLYKMARVQVKNETSEYNGKTYENLNIKYWEETKYPNLQHQFKDDTKDKDNMTASELFASGAVISDDDLPF